MTYWNEENDQRRIVLNAFKAQILRQTENVGIGDIDSVVCEPLLPTWNFAKVTHLSKNANQ